MHGAASYGQCSCGQGPESAHGGLWGDPRGHVAGAAPLVSPPGWQVGKQTVATLSMPPAGAVDAIEAVLQGETLVDTARGQSAEVDLKILLGGRAAGVAGPDRRAER